MKGGKGEDKVIRVGIEYPAGGKDPLLKQINQQQPLSAFIHEICLEWSLEDYEKYSLKISATCSLTGKDLFVTEASRVQVKNGDILKLYPSPPIEAQNILDKLNNPEGNSEGELQALKKLADISDDVAFAQEFIHKQGPALIIFTIEEGRYTNGKLALALDSFVNLMSHGILSWEILDKGFINKIVHNINNHGQKQRDSKEPRTSINSGKILPNLSSREDSSTSILQSSFIILEGLVTNSGVKGQLVNNATTIPNLIFHLVSPPEVQTYVLALINALLLKADPTKLKCMIDTLTSPQYRNIIVKNIIQDSTDLEPEMRHQLYVMQTLMLNQMAERMNTRRNPEDKDAIQKIKDLCQAAFDTDEIRDNTPRRQDYKKLGFKNTIDPSSDFNEIPPGMLALDNMIYFSTSDVERYTKLVLENSCRGDQHECPFAKASIELTTLLIDIFKIGEPPMENRNKYYPMLFTHDQAFKELFNICIVLVNKTWKEMKATTEDFAKVFSVVREQIERSLEWMPVSLETFKVSI